VKFNNIFGYFIEISKANTGSVPSHYIRKQSLVNAERYTIPELSEYEEKINSASEKVMKLEEEIFNGIVEEISESSGLLLKLARNVAVIDAYSNFALIAGENDYTKPLIYDSSEFFIKEGRHPVVEKYLGKNLFVPNDTLLDDEDSRIIILTGPNMAGKSTYLRQNALIAIMAQIGSFVPAREARIGMVDKIFTRIGASDNLSLGRSTFLVEMQEAANIIRGSSPKSLIIMDELGRGTSTYDGLSIAWSVIEYLHEQKTKTGRTLFATHYHELTRLGSKKGIRNYNIAVREYGEELIFLRRVVEGPSDRSYGIYVARLAGIPGEIIERARVILETLEAEGDRAGDRIETIFNKNFRKPGEIESSSEIGLFTDPSYKNVIDKIQNIDIDRITPLEAIAFLGEIKKLI
jgi:DNA mismatch repair protein MutS